VNESRISLIRVGMPVEITVDAARDRKLSGTVIKVNQYAEPGSWSSGNIQKYASFIEIHDPPPAIRTGMNAEVRIFVERLPGALQIPVQALCESKGHYFCLIKSGERFETREVQVGSSNDSFMIVRSGLQENEVVVMNPRSLPDRLMLPDLPDVKPVVAAVKPPAKKPPPGRADGKTPAQGTDGAPKVTAGEAGRGGAAGQSAATSSRAAGGAL
jgi:hypothetical protein